MEALLGIGIGFLVLFIGLCIASYVIHSIAFMKVAEKIGYDKGWMIWIPIANTYAIGEIGNLAYKKKGKESKFKGALPILLVGLTLVQMLFVFTESSGGGILMLVGILECIAMYGVFDLIDENSKGLFILYLFIPCIALLLLAKKDYTENIVYTQTNEEHEDN